MIWLLATRGLTTKLRSSPFTETAITGAHSIVYKPGVEAIPGAGDSSGALGTFTRGGHRVSGIVFSYNGAVAETIFAISNGIDLLIRYRANGQKRLRTLLNVLFVGDATVTVPGLNEGLSELIGVPFRLQIPSGETLADHITDAVES
ncbi:MAG: hypothetical protein HY287_05855 [Planctomycetes bacterium]|nr:hypothetical protein [Planctomycetota bacterium]MBI3833836.1 hypothetical protein [Planctomycetota bacterium]